ncbi:hypothetical protein SLEP1_g13254 [Rubroshorea leprosula]|uniref:Uncharacterized protein n=1 Tax=Rubroshorea leprosula TaxID=152421 RepID=A0AAV5IF84_9ROSI|nr:hypothetical protein SLEP1_g13254 [Rubroshorea leprosula]
MNPDKLPPSHRLLFLEKIGNKLDFSLPFLVKELILGPRTLPLK